MFLALMALIVVLVLATWLFIRSRSASDDSGRASRASSVQPASRKSRFHAVSIKLADYPCAAAKELSGRRFLSTEAPKLPLPGCTADNCTCRFIHHKDRRAGKDRRSPFGPAGFGPGTGNYESEQRKGEDRRTHDEDDYF
jgi:hypothetical protein